MVLCESTFFRTILRNGCPVGPLDGNEVDNESTISTEPLPTKSNLHDLPLNPGRGNNMNKKNEYKAPFGVDITHPGIRLIYVLLGVVFIWGYFKDDDLQSTGDLIRMVVFSPFFLMMALFAPQIARRNQRKRMEYPNPWTETARRPLRGLISSICGVALFASLFAYELLESDSVTMGILVLCGGTSLFLWSYVHAKVNDRCNCLLRTLFASPFFVGFVYAVCRLGYLNDQLGNEEATFPWVWFGFGCVASLVIPFCFEQQQLSNVENAAETETTDTCSEIDSESAVTEPASDE